MKWAVTKTGTGNAILETQISNIFRGHTGLP